MTLSFSTKWPDRMGGEPTHFVEKTWNSFGNDFVHDNFTEYLDLGLDGSVYDFSDDAIDMRPKPHTIREDPHDRWKVGMKIHPVINNRTPQRFQFAPILECKGIQKIEIRNPFPQFPNFFSNVRVDGRKLNSTEMHNLATNDGFDSIEHFFQWFNKDFTGKIIHWTNLKY